MPRGLESVCVGLTGRCRGRGTEADGVTRSSNRSDVAVEPEVVDFGMPGMDSCGGPRAGSIGAIV